MAALFAVVENDKSSQTKPVPSSVNESFRFDQVIREGEDTETPATAATGAATGLAVRTGRAAWVEQLKEYIDKLEADLHK